MARTLLSQATLEPVWGPVFCALEVHAKGQGQGKNARVQSRTGQDMLQRLAGGWVCLSPPFADVTGHLTGGGPS